VHSSTLVTAGVYLLIRFNWLFRSKLAGLYLLRVGTLTIILAGIAALWETDIKKIIALSTLSQLGLMVTALALNIKELAFFHLLTHAYFKALLFITVGNIIHLRSDYQDLRNLKLWEGSLGPTLSFSLVANFRLIGLPFLSGFYSKDAIMETGLLGTMGVIPGLLLFLAARLTAAYTLRFLFLTSWGPRKGGPRAWADDNSPLILRAMRWLWPLAIIGGRALRWGLLLSPLTSPLSFGLKGLVPLAIFRGILLGTLWIWLSSQQSPLLKLTTWGWGVMWALPFSRTRRLTQALPLLTGLARTRRDLTWLPNSLLSFPTAIQGVSNYDSIARNLGYKAFIASALSLRLILVFYFSIIILEIQIFLCSNTLFKIKKD
jgi:NADH-ubiquinone oxidoreductase chain 5